jgi:hypothetical protein
VKSSADRARPIADQCRCSGRSPTPLVAGADLDALAAALGELRAAGWPAPEDPDSGEDTELSGRDSIAADYRMR